MITVIAFYKFVELADCETWQQGLLHLGESQGIRGTILLAPEGINGTIAGTPAAIAHLLAYLRSDPRLADLTGQESTVDTLPFQRLKVKIKPEIVTLGQAVNPQQQVGTYVEPADWNALIADPDILVVDTRNAFEVRLGSFKGAIDPQTTSFRQFPAYVQAQLEPQTQAKIALFCTGGIRCEKATSYLLSQGFAEVYHLQGGILNYLKTVDPAESLWDGDCFVFDDRIALQHGLTPAADYAFCPTCGNPLSAQDQTSPQYTAGDRCPYCPDADFVASAEE